MLGDMALGPGQGMARLAFVAVLLAILAASLLPTSHGEPDVTTPQTGDSKNAQQWTGPLVLEWDQTPSHTVEKGPVSFAFSAVDAFGLPCGDCVYSCYLDGQWQDCHKARKKLNVTQVGKHTFTTTANSSTAGTATTSWTFTVVDRLPRLEGALSSNTALTYNTTSVHLVISFSGLCQRLACPSPKNCAVKVKGPGQAVPESFREITPGLKYSVDVRFTHTFGRLAMWIRRESCQDTFGRGFQGSASSKIVMRYDTRPLRATLATSATPMTISQGNSAPRTGLVARDWSGLLLQLRFLSPVFNSSSDVLNALVITGGTPTILEGNARRLRIAIIPAASGPSLINVALPAGRLCNYLQSCNTAIPELSILYSNRSLVPSLTPLFAAESLLAAEASTTPVLLQFPLPVANFTASAVRIPPARVTGVAALSPASYLLDLEGEPGKAQALLQVTSENVTDVTGRTLMASPVLTLGQYVGAPGATGIATAATVCLAVSAGASALVSASLSALSGAGVLGAASLASPVMAPSVHFMGFMFHAQFFALTSWLAGSLPATYHEASKQLRWVIPQLPLPWLQGARPLGGLAQSVHLQGGTVRWMAVAGAGGVPGSGTVSASKVGAAERKLMGGQRTAPEAWDGGLGMMTWRGAEGAQPLSLNGAALWELGVPGVSQEEDDSPGAGWSFYTTLPGNTSPGTGRATLQGLQGTERRAERRLEGETPVTSLPSAPPAVLAALSAQSAMLLAASKTGSPMPTAYPAPLDAVQWQKILGDDTKERIVTALSSASMWTLAGSCLFWMALALGCCLALHTLLALVLWACPGIMSAVASPGVPKALLAASSAADAGDTSGEEEVIKGVPGYLRSLAFLGAWSQAPRLLLRLDLAVLLVCLPGAGLAASYLFQGGSAGEILVAVLVLLPVLLGVLLWAGLRLMSLQFSKRQVVYKEQAASGSGPAGSPLAAKTRGLVLGLLRSDTATWQAEEGRMWPVAGSLFEHLKGPHMGSGPRVGQVTMVRDGESLRQVRVEAPSCLTLEMHLSDKLRASYPILHMCYRISLAVLAGAFPLAGVATTPDAVTQVVLLLFFSLVHLVALLLLQPFRSRAVQIQESLCGALEVLLLALVVAVEASGDPAAMSAGSSQDSGLVAILCIVLGIQVLGFWGALVSQVLTLHRHKGALSAIMGVASTSAHQGRTAPGAVHRVLDSLWVLLGGLCLFVPSWTRWGAKKKHAKGVPATDGEGVGEASVDWDEEGTGQVALRHNDSLSSYRHSGMESPASMHPAGSSRAGPRAGAATNPDGGARTLHPGHAGAGAAMGDSPSASSMQHPSSSGGSAFQHWRGGGVGDQEALSLGVSGSGPTPRRSVTAGPRAGGAEAEGAVVLRSASRILSTLSGKSGRAANLSQGPAGTQSPGLSLSDTEASSVWGSRGPGQWGASGHATPGGHSVAAAAAASCALVHTGAGGAGGAGHGRKKDSMWGAFLRAVGFNDNHGADPEASAQISGDFGQGRAGSVSVSSIHGTSGALGLSHRDGEGSGMQRTDTGTASGTGTEVSAPTRRILAHWEVETLKAALEQGIVAASAALEEERLSQGSADVRDSFQSGTDLGSQSVCGSMTTPGAPVSSRGVYPQEAYPPHYSPSPSLAGYNLSQSQGSFSGSSAGAPSLRAGVGPAVGMGAVAGAGAGAGTWAPLHPLLGLRQPRTDADSSMDYSDWSNASGTLDGSAMGAAESRASRGAGQGQGQVQGGLASQYSSGTPREASQRPLPLGSPMTPAVAPPIILASTSPDLRETPMSRDAGSRSNMRATQNTSADYGAAVIPVSQSPQGVTPYFAGDASLAAQGTPSLFEAPGSGSGARPMITPEASKPFQQLSEGSLRKVKKGSRKGAGSGATPSSSGAGIPEEDPSPGEERGGESAGRGDSAGEAGEKDRRTPSGGISVGGVLGGVASQMLRGAGQTLFGTVSGRAVPASAGARGGGASGPLHTPASAGGTGPHMYDALTPPQWPAHHSAFKGPGGRLEGGGPLHEAEPSLGLENNNALSFEPQFAGSSPPVMSSRNHRIGGNPEHRPPVLCESTASNTSGNMFGASGTLGQGTTRDTQENELYASANGSSCGPLH